jgi:hypothetical protein
VYVLSVLQLPLDTLVFMLNRFTADDFSKEGIPAGGESVSTLGFGQQQSYQHPAAHAYKRQCTLCSSSGHQMALFGQTVLQASLDICGVLACC